MDPKIEMIPHWPVVARDRETVIDVLLKISPPSGDECDEQIPLNLGLVIDRSGSMRGLKLDYAKKAARYLVENLNDTDRVSITIFDDNVDTIATGTLAREKKRLVNLINRIQARGTTALHDGWVQGGVEVGTFLDASKINRVILLSDGLANRGLTNPDLIARDVRGLSNRGISTSTLGLGEDYDERLLAAMAESGDGNFFHIDSPAKLPEIFSIELEGLVNTFGLGVSLAVRLHNGVILEDMFNDFERDRQGAFVLPNMISDNTLRVVIRLRVPPILETKDIFSIDLGWNEPKLERRTVASKTLRMESVASDELDHLTADEEVIEEVALLQVARAKEEAISWIDQGEYETAENSLDTALGVLEGAPPSESINYEIDSLENLKRQIIRGEEAMFSKTALYESYNMKKSRDTLTYKR
jgi:Ca-activated chloride channel homolog